MPILAVAAVAAGATAALTMGAGIALASAITYVGIGTSVVGAITGNKNMMKVGGIMGLAGGAMSLAGIGTAAGAGAVEAAGAVAGDTMYGASEIASQAAATGAGEVAATQGLSEVAQAVAPELAEAGVQSTGVLNAVRPEAMTGMDTLINSTPLPTMATAPTSVVPEAANVISKAIDPMQSNSVASIGKAEAMAGGDKESWWNGLSKITQQELLRGGIGGVRDMFANWSQQEIQDFQMNRAKEQQANLNAQPKVMRYQGGVLNATKGI